MTEWQWTVAVLGAGLGSYVLRAAPFWYKASREFGRRHLRCLTYISFAVAAGIVSRAIFLAGGELTFDREAWIKVLAVVVAVVLYRGTRNMPVALFSAVGTAVLVQWAVTQGLAP
jgi:branched-subunit amino acid transport protein